MAAAARSQPPRDPARILVLQHAREGRPGLIGDALADRGLRVETGFPHEGEPFPETPESFDGLVLMGGIMSAYDDDLCPHYPALLGLIRACEAAARPVLGVCLGAQLVARAFGGDVHPFAHVEFGFFPLSATADAARDPVTAGLPERLSLMQWHGDTFTLPADATLLLRGDDCPNQAMRIGRWTYAFQCHFEVTRDMALEWAAVYARLSGGDAEALKARIEAEWRAHGADAMRWGRAIAERWIDRVEAARDERAGGGPASS